jgi:hypothetical protein
VNITQREASINSHRNIRATTFSRKEKMREREREREREKDDERKKIRKKGLKKKRNF